MEEIFFCPGCMTKTEPVDGKCPVCGCNVNMENAPHQLPVNTILYGRYIVGRVLGAGGFGITYIGYDLKLDGRVAIKEYYPSGAANRSVSLTVYPTAEGNGNPFETGKERFLKEARVLSGFIEDSSIVTLRDYFEENGTAYIVMEYLDGEDLSHYAVRHGKFTFDEALDLLEPAMLALDKVHKKGLIHRDISPSNLMVLSDGRIKVLDFGAARLQSVNGELSLSVMLKPGYAPIEQYSTHGEQGPWTDVYAMSATFYRLITGKAPTSATDRTCGSAVELPSALGVKITPAQEGALMHGLALQSADRTQTMAGLAESLRAKKTVHGSKPEKPKAPEKPEKRDKSGKPALPKKRLIAIGASALVVLAACLTLPALRNGTDSSAAKQEEQKLSIEELAAARESIAAHSEITVSSGTRQTAGIKSDGTVCYSGCYQGIEPVLDSWTDIAALSSGDSCVVGLKTDGTVVAANADENISYDVSVWKNITAVSAGYAHIAGLTSDGTVIAAGSGEYGRCNVGDWTDIVAVSAGCEHTVGLRSDGTVIAVGSNSDGQCDVGDWRNIIAVSAGWYHTVGLKADGTVVAVGRNGDGQCEVSSWTDIVAVSAGLWHTVGLKSDGTVVSAGSKDEDSGNVMGWTDIVAVSAGWDHTVGLKADGTAVYAGPGLNAHGVADWQDIRLPLGERKELGTKNKKTEDKKPESAELSLSIDNALLNETTLSTYRTNTVGLRSDGTVVAAGSNEDGECDVSDWRDIIAVSTGNGCIFGLKANGTVIAIGNNLDEQCEVSNWTNIVAVSAGQWHTVGLRADGTVVAVGSTIDGQCSVSGWRDIVAVSAGSDFTAGLRSDGTVVATGQLFDVSGWKDIAAISAGGAFLAGLRPDGTVLVTVPQVLDVSAWTDIVAISAGESHIVGLRADGTVVAAGFNESSACKVSDWTGIVAVSAGDGYTLGLRADGTVITTKYTGEYNYGQCNVTGWKDIRLPKAAGNADNDVIEAGTL
ncbi:MAG: protein kinase [Clostridiales bacterium]|nr:protein kinase [Clostridiales bacterium]